MHSLTKVSFLLLATVAVAGFAKGASDETAGFAVAGHRFKVPKDHLFEISSPWLPKPESDAFTFLFEPNSEPKQIPKHRVLVQPLSRSCPTDATTEASQMLRIACGQETSTVPDTPPFIKTQNELGSWSSDLYAVGKAPDERGTLIKRKVAYCQLFGSNPAKPEPSTLCTTFWSYNGMMLQFSFDEKESSEMPKIKARAIALLDRWEVR